MGFRSGYWLARVQLQYHCPQTTSWPVCRYVLDHRLFKSITPPPPFPVPQSFPP